MYGGAPRSGGVKLEATGSTTFSPAVSRSSELLASAKTAIKVARSHNNGGMTDPTDPNPPWWTMDPNLLRLSSLADIPTSSPVVSLCEDGLSLLRSMQATLIKLQGLVRRRGHTNDPTHQISVCTKQLETDAKELATTVQSLQAIPTKHSQQYKKHLQLVATWLQQVASNQSTELKDILKLRGTVLADQAQRRKLLNPSSSSKKSSAGGRSRPGARNGTTPNPTPAMMMNSPLFTQTQNPAPTTRRPPAATPRMNGRSSRTANGGASTTNGHARQPAAPRAASAASPYYSGSSTSGGYGGYGGGGYGGGGYGGTPQTGMRRRGGGGSSSSAGTNPYQQQQQEDDAANVQSQIQQRQIQRQTQNRLDSARQAESTLHELGTVFGKMSQLISQQGEVLEKVEDDVEAAMVDVTAGQNEIQILYQMKKGNRGLIIKVFAILIFFILFMRFY